MSTLRIEELTPQNFPALLNLVEQQAAHHECVYRGDNEVMQRELLRENASARVYMARDPEDGGYAGYVLYNIIAGPKGSDLYIEDICVDERKRSHGVGAVLFQEAQRLSQENGCNGVCWSVAENNTRALNFYQGKFDAKRKAVSGFDLSDLPLSRPQVGFVDDGDVQYRLMMPESDIPLLTTLSAREEIPINANSVANLRKAAESENEVVFVAEGSDGMPRAVLVANSNFSSFRTVYGYKVEIVDLDIQSQSEANQVYDGLLRALRRHAETHDHTGHVYWFAHETSPTQIAYAARRNMPALLMSNDPGSRLDLYATGNAIAAFVPHDDLTHAGADGRNNGHDAPDHRYRYG